MKNRKNAPTTKPHYEILDGLRGVAAIMILAFHVLEAYNVSGETIAVDIPLAHAYLAVDFFFALSGFVIGYAYDDRWRSMTILNFLKRRVLRLHPMVILGTLLGMSTFYACASAVFPLVQAIPLWQLLLYTLLGMLMIPTPPSADIRGWQEMYTLDAPAWSLAYEYIANILYALFIRKFTRTALAILVILAACATLHLTLTEGDVIGGWAADARGARFGITRVIYPFFAGLLLYRLGRVIRLPRAFAWCTLVLVAALAFPRVGGVETPWLNGLYEASIILLLFPLIVAAGAGGQITGRLSSRACKLLGDISYPLYLVNYPVCYVHTAWISDRGHDFASAGWIPYAVFAGTLLLAYLVTRCYDIPVRRWLRDHLSS
ncbi:MAG: acyltransferase [Odoribacteraceae bacterium]|jgi:peptidoglycan/LPS O-acetylase OafA/YrhL|nr:acyltransferase [Odoribacteraceae bacterium]